MIWIFLILTLVFAFAVYVVEKLRDSADNLSRKFSHFLFSPIGFNVARAKMDKRVDLLHCSRLDFDNAKREGKTVRTPSGQELILVQEMFRITSDIDSEMEQKLFTPFISGSIISFDEQESFFKIPFAKQTRKIIQEKMEANRKAYPEIRRWEWFEKWECLFTFLHTILIVAAVVSLILTGGFIATKLGQREQAEILYSYVNLPNGDVLEEKQSRLDIKELTFVYLGSEDRIYRGKVNRKRFIGGHLAVICIENKGYGRCGLSALDQVVGDMAYIRFAEPIFWVSETKVDHRGVVPFAISEKDANALVATGKFRFHD